MFVKKREQRAVFEAAFALFWRRRGLLEKMIALLSPTAPPRPPSNEPPKAAETRVRQALGPEPRIDDTPPEVEIDAQLDAEDTDALDRATDTYHQCGGARMGHHARDGVVDSELRVFGTRNLYVAGAAVFRTSSYANPTFTALALTARLAHRLHLEPAIA